MFMLHGRLGAKPGHRDDLLTILTEAEPGEPMPGCRLYLVAVDPTDAEGVWVTEVWDSEEAHRASLELERVRDQIRRAMPIIDTEGFRRQQLDALTGVPPSSPTA